VVEVEVILLEQDSAVVLVVVVVVLLLVRLLLLLEVPLHLPVRETTVELVFQMGYPKLTLVVVEELDRSEKMLFSTVEQVKVETV
jgi:hypothetical protein